MQLKRKNSIHPQLNISCDIDFCSSSHIMPATEGQGRPDQGMFEILILNLWQFCLPSGLQHKRKKENQSPPTNSTGGIHLGGVFLFEGAYHFCFQFSSKETRLTHRRTTAPDECTNVKVPCFKINGDSRLYLQLA